MATPALEPAKPERGSTTSRDPDRDDVLTVPAPPQHSEAGSGIDLATANHQVANYLAQVGWSEEAAGQRARRLVEKARESLEASESYERMSQRQLVRSALALAIESASASTAKEVVPTVCMQPMVGGGQARRVKWLRLDWWLAQLRRA